MIRLRKATPREREPDRSPGCRTLGYNRVRQSEIV